MSEQPAAVFSDLERAERINALMDVLADRPVHVPTRRERRAAQRAQATASRKVARSAIRGRRS